MAHKQSNISSLKQVGLFFGSFNPIHNGHLSLARYIADHTPLDEIWFVVSPNNPMKDKNTLMDENLRIELARLATEDDARLQVTDIELTLPRPSYTVNTLRMLSKQFSEIQFALIIGSDNMAIFNRWREYEYILDTYPIYVYPRKGDDLGVLQKEYPKMTILSDAPMFNISATEIREMLQAGEDITALMPPKAAERLAQYTQKGY